MLTWVQLYGDLKRLAPRVYLPLLGLQLLALTVSLVPGQLSGPARGVAAALVPLVFDPLITGTSLAFARDRVLERTTGFTDAIGVAFRIWPKLIATSLITVLFAMAPTGWLFYLAYKQFERAAHTGGDLLALGLPFAGMIACALPGIYIGVRLFVTVPLLFIEEHSPLSAQKRSWQLTEGLWSSAALSYVPLGLLTLALAGGLGVVLAGTALGSLLAPDHAPTLVAGGILALRLVGPLGWSLYVLYCLRLIRVERPLKTQTHN